MGQAPSDDATLTADGAGPANVAADPREPGTTLGRYQLRRRLGDGAMGTVHLAYDPDLDRLVALKVLRTTPGGASTGEGSARARLLREARAMAKVSHPAVIAVHEVGTADGVDYVAMEYFDGGTLADWLRAHPRDPNEVIAALTEAGRGLAAAHARGLIHRDFKPHNVLRTQAGRIGVGDFGLARAQQVPAAPPDPMAQTLPPTAPPLSPGSWSSTLTATGAVLGTPAYMAPEQLRGEDVGPTADQFSWCVALWEGLTGKRPFAASHLADLPAAIAAGPTGGEALPGHVRAALARGLAPEPSARFPSMHALLAAISPTRPRPRVWPWIAGFGVVGLVGALWAGRAMAPDATNNDPRCGAAGLADQARAIDQTLGERDDTTARAVRDHVAVLKRQTEATCRAAEAREQKDVRLACLATFWTEASQAAQVPPTSPAGNNVVEWLIEPTACALPSPATRPVEVDLATVANGFVEDLALPKASACATMRYQAARLVRVDRAAQREALAELERLAPSCPDPVVIAEVALTKLELELENPILGNSYDTQRAVVLARLNQIGEPRALALRLQALDAVQRIRQSGVGGDTAIDVLAFMVTGGALGQARYRRLLLTALSYASAHGNATDPAVVGKLIDGSDDESAQRAAMQYAWQNGAWADYARYRDLLPPFTSTAVDQVAIAGSVQKGGTPVADAEVACAERLFADARSLTPGLDAATTKTDAAGRYALSCPPKGVVAARALDLTAARPYQGAGSHRLDLAPTRRIAVDVGDLATRVGLIDWSTARVRGFAVAAPLAARPLTLDQVPREAGVVGYAETRGLIMTRVMVPVDATTTQARLRLPTMRGKRRVLVRSTAAVNHDFAQVLVLDAMPTVRDVRGLEDAIAAGRVTYLATLLPRPWRPDDGLGQAGDLLAEVLVPELPHPVLCGIGFTGDPSDPAFTAQLIKHGDKVPLVCQPLDVAPTDLVLEVPLMPRLP